MPSAKLQNYTIHFHNSEEYHHLKRELFTHDLYYFETENPTPIIIDAGAHIGLATLYFKQLFPKAHITAIEPNPYLFELLEQNVFENQLENVACLNKALANSPGTLPFYIDQTANQWWSTGSFTKGAWTHEQQSEEIMVETITLSSFISGPTDLIKLDIEAAEQLVLEECQDSLHHVAQLHIEFHSTREQNLFKLTELLKKHGFSLTYSKDGVEQPRLNIHQPKGLIHIHATRKTKKK